MSAWRDELPGDVDDLRIGRDGDVRTDRRDLAVAQHDRAIRDGSVRHRQNGRAAKRHDAGGSGRRLARQPRDRGRQHHHERSNEKRPPGQIAAGHDNLQRG